jgi:hypothetical protein
MVVLTLCCLTLPFSASTAFAATNVTNNTYNNVSNANATIQNVTGTVKTVTNVNKSTQVIIQSTVKNTSSNVTKVNTSSVAKVNSSTSQVKSNSNLAAGSALTTFTSSEIDNAAARVQSFVVTNHRLPNYVTIDDQQITMSDFLELMSQSIVNDNLGVDVSVTLRNVGSLPNSSESIVSGNIYKAEYITLAKDILSYVNANGKLPNYETTSLGKISMQNLIYSFSKVLNFQGTDHRLPNYVSVVSWSSLNSSKTTGEGSSTTITTISSSVTAILNKIGEEEAKFADVQGVTYNGLDDAGVITHYGYGDCWADSSWLYDQLSAAKIQVRIMGYSNAPASSSWYRHAWVQIDIGNGWVDWNYAGYGSQHHGNGGGYTPKVLIDPGHAPAEIGSTGY